MDISIHIKCMVCAYVKRVTYNWEGVAGVRDEHTYTCIYIYNLRTYYYPQRSINISKRDKKGMRESNMYTTYGRENE